MNKPTWPYFSVPKTERNKELISLYKEGTTYKELAQLFNISQVRVGQIIAIYRAREKAKA